METNENKTQVPPPKATLAELKSQLAALAQQRDAVLSELQGVADRVFEDSKKELFEKNPTLESFGWAQYTPYFSDGGPNIFGVDAAWPDINDVDGYKLSFGDQQLHSLQALQTKVAKFLEELPRDYYQQTFDDHSRITCYRDGRIETTDYSHD